MGAQTIEKIHQSASVASDWTRLVYMPSNSNSEDSAVKYTVGFQYTVYSALDVDADSATQAEKKVKDMLREHGLAIVNVEESEYSIDFVEEIE